MLAVDFLSHPECIVGVTRFWVENWQSRRERGILPPHNNHINHLLVPPVRACYPSRASQQSSPVQPGQPGQACPMSSHLQPGVPPKNPLLQQVVVHVCAFVPSLDIAWLHVDLI